MTRGRGMALIQALVIVAAVAGVATALLVRAEAARTRLQARADADQLALYLDAGVTMVRAMLDTLPPEGPVHRGQVWAQPRGGLVIDRGSLAWQVEDLQGRFNLGLLAQAGANGETARAAFLALAAAVGIAPETARRMADLAGPDPARRAAAAAPGRPPPLPLVDPGQLAPLASDDPGAFDRLRPLLAAIPVEAALNINTAPPEVLAAHFPGLDRLSRETLLSHLRRTPATSVDALLEWAERTLPAAAADLLGAFDLSTGSDHFSATLVARLDSAMLRRSVDLSRGEAPLRARFAVRLSHPGPD